MYLIKWLIAKCIDLFLADLKSSISNCSTGGTGTSTIIVIWPIFSLFHAVESLPPPPTSLLPESQRMSSRLIYMYSLQKRVQCARYRVQCAGCIVQCAVCSVQCTVCRVQGARCRVQGAIHSVQCTAHSSWICSLQMVWCAIAGQTTYCHDNFSYILRRFVRDGDCAKSWRFYVYFRSLKWQFSWTFSGSYNKARNSTMCGSRPVVLVKSGIQPYCCHSASRLIFVWIWLDKCLRWGQYLVEWCQYLIRVVSKIVSLQLVVIRIILVTRKY